MLQEDPEGRRQSSGRRYERSQRYIQRIPEGRNGGSGWHGRVFVLRRDFGMRDGNVIGKPIYPCYVCGTDGDDDD